MRIPGGIEAYCLAASAMLSSRGTFVVCENWSNDDRVWRGAEDAGLTIECVRPVMGCARRWENLFAVYVMKKTADGKCDDERRLASDVIWPADNRKGRGWKMDQ